MKHFQGTSEVAARILLLILLPAFTVLAEDNYVKSHDPVFPAVQPDRALVYFVRTEFMHLIPLQTFTVFVDDTPAGFLPQRSYLAVQVEAGRRLVWGPSQSQPQRFEFKAGNTYLLLLVEKYYRSSNAGNLLEGTSWASGDPADVRGLVAAKKLSYVTPTEEGLAHLRHEAAKDYEGVRKKAPDAAAATLPATFETVWYRPGKRGFSMKAYDATGTLTVDQQTIEFKSSKKTVVIPVKDIQSVSLDKVTGAANFADTNQWGIVKFNASGSTEVAAFRDGHRLGSGGDTERIYMALRSAAQSAEATASAQAETAAQLPEGFVLNEGFKDQFTIAIPQGWMAYDQSQALKGISGRWNIIFFLASKDFATEAPGQGLMSSQVLRKVDSGEIPSFFIQRVPADKGMSCAGFSEKAEKKLLNLIARDPVLKENLVEPPHADPAAVGGCKGLRIRGKGQPSGGTPWVVDAYVASDGETLYIFSLRNLAENYAKNTDIFQKVISTARLSVAK